jgi:surfactin synthase thioesterase subunit
LDPTSRWVADDGPAEGLDAARQLFCFAHAGGGPAFFRQWRAWLAPEIAVRRVLLPGREPLSGSRLECPVAAYLSTDDPDVGYDGVLRWREVTTGEFSVP